EMTPEQQREQFIRGLNPMNHPPSSFPIFPTANPYADTNRSGLTKSEIEDLIKTTMASSQPQTAQQNTDLQSTIKSLQETMSRAIKILDNSKKSADKRAEDNT
ncbi:10565_t:CDS:2, partial [Ambispora leptoticha]